jgi:hypothetical protein
MKLIEFKENKDKRIIVTDEGEKEIDEKTMTILWWKWIMYPDVFRRDYDDFIVFSFKTPVNYKTFLKEAEIDYIPKNIDD